MRRFPFLAAMALVFSASLAACGGGGSSSGGLPPTTGGGGGGSKNTLALHGGFETTSKASSRASGVHILATKDRFPLDVNLTALPLAAMFMVPDPYITNGSPAGIWGAQVIAYLTTSDGTLNGIPTPLPSPSISQSGPQMVVGSPIPAPSASPAAPPVSLGGFDLSAPTTTGQTIVTLSATVNGQVMTSTVKGDNYPEMCVASSDSAGTSGGSFGCPAGLYWDAQGAVHTTSSLASADVFLQLNGDGTTTLECPSGCSAITGAVPLYNTLSTQATTQTSFTGPAIYAAEANGSEAVTLDIKTATGYDIKWEVAGQTAGTGNLGINGGDIAMMAGPYLATNTSTFAY